MSKSINKSLNKNHDKNLLINRANDFSLDKISNEYINYIFKKI